MSDVRFIDNSQQVLEAFRTASIIGLEECGLIGEGYAKKECPVDTGNLRNSVSHKVDEAEPSVYIGTNEEYGPYVELGRASLQNQEDALRPGCIKMQMGTGTGHRETRHSHF